MSAAQLTFWGIVVGGSMGLTASFYPGVAKHAASAKDAMIASAMAGVLCATTTALAVSAVVNAISYMF